MTSLNLGSLKERHQMMVQSYHDFITDLREDGPEDETEGLSSDFLENFKRIIKAKTLNEYGPLNFYWVNLVDNLIFVLQMWQDADEEGLTDFWTESEYAQAFIGLSEQGQNPVEVTQELMPLLEGQVLGFYHWHISVHHKAKENPTLYQLVPDIGDHDLGIRVGETQMIAPPDGHSDSPSLPFWSKSIAEGIVSIDDDGGELVGGIQDLKTVELGKKMIAIKGSTPQLDRDLDLHIIKIEKALSIIKECSPGCHEALEVFTNSLVLMDEPGVVSYSLQSLPGYSNINVVERDFVDLIDDLVHENGHHALNAILNAEELIEEDDDKVFWSPWRKALRPIRGLYHGYLTFYWAFALFGDIYRCGSDQLTKEEMEKVQLRFVEEFIMLNFCHTQLDKAFKLDKILPAGMELVKQTKAIIEAQKNFVEQVIAEKLSPANKGEIDQLVEQLNQANQQYL